MNMWILSLKIHFLIFFPTNLESLMVIKNIHQPSYATFMIFYDWIYVIIMNVGYLFFKNFNCSSYFQLVYLKTYFVHQKVLWLFGRDGQRFRFRYFGQSTQGKQRKSAWKAWKTRTESVNKALRSADNDAKGMDLLLNIHKLTAVRVNSSVFRCYLCVL